MGLAILLAACLATRLPSIYNPRLLLTGDEAVMGLMAKHVYEGRPWPFYFYGNLYGFCLPETLAAVLFFPVFGVEAIALKYGMLLLFTAGLACFYLLASRLTHPIGGLLAALLLLAMPPWAGWSLQIRGGYLVSALLSPLILWLLFRSDRPVSTGLGMGSGFLSGVLVHAQPLWLPGLLPLAAFRLTQRRKVAPGLVFLGTLLATVFAGRWLMTAYTETFLPYIHKAWQPPAPQMTGLASRFSSLGPRIWEYLSNDLLFGARPIGYRVVGGVWCALFLLGLVLETRRLLRRDWNPLPHLLFVSTVACLGCALIGDPQPRYLLPLGGHLILWIVFEAWLIAQGRPRTARVLFGAALGVALTGCASIGLASGCLVHPRPTRSAEQNFKAMIATLQQAGIRHTYSLDPMLMWQIIFYSHEEVLSRWQLAHDRYPLYSAAVDQALYGPERTALIGHIDLLHELASPGDPRLLGFRGMRCLAYLEPEPDLLRQIGFELNPPTSEPLRPEARP